MNLFCQAERNYFPGQRRFTKKRWKHDNFCLFFSYTSNDWEKSLQSGYIEWAQGDRCDRGAIFEIGILKLQIELIQQIDNKMRLLQV